MHAPRIFFRGKILLNQLQEGYLHTSLSIPCLWGQPQARTCEGKGKFQFYSISANITSQSTKNFSLCPVPLGVVGDHLDHKVVHRHHLAVARAAAAAGGSHQGGAHRKVGLVGGEQAELVPPAAGVVAWCVNIYIYLEKYAIFRIVIFFAGDSCLCQKLKWINVQQRIFFAKKIDKYEDIGFFCSTCVFRDCRLKVEDEDVVVQHLVWQKKHYHQYTNIPQMWDKAGFPGASKFQNSPGAQGSSSWLRDRCRAASPGPRRWKIFPVKILFYLLFISFSWEIKVLRSPDSCPAALPRICAWGTSRPQGWGPPPSGERKKKVK